MEQIDNTLISQEKVNAYLGNVQGTCETADKLRLRALHSDCLDY